MKAINFIFIICMPILLAAQSIYPGQFKDKVIIDVIETPVECFELSEVKLLPSRFRENLQRDSAWMMSIPVDRLLHSFYNNSGVWGGKEGGYMTIKKLGGWESMDCELRGHTTGHLLSALSLMYAATDEDCFKQKGDSIILGLSKVQKALGNGYLSAFPEELINRNIRGESVWAPWYTLHKILAGLIDQYLYSDNQEALELAKGMGDWASKKLESIDEETRAKMLRNEFGGINEAFYNLYAITGENRYKDLAEFFYHNEVIDPLKSKDNDFGTKHTNTFIPKVLGEIRNYELTGNKDSKELTTFFWDEMINNHVYPSGSLSDKEHYFPLDKYEEHITGYTGETCCTYNMLKLGKHLFCATPDSKIFDYYERGLYNHILGQQNPETGMVIYFLPLSTGTHKVYSTPENSFWCCVGSGFENHAKYAESVYFKSNDNENLYVNLYIPSELNWKEKGFNMIQENNFPEVGTSTLLVSESGKSPININLRIPYWADGIRIKINGKKHNLKKEENGYLSLKRNWKRGDKIDIEFDTNLRKENSPAEDLVTLFYGPFLLAGRLGTEGMKSPAPVSNPELYNDYYTYDYNISEGIEKNLDFDNIKRIEPLKWQTSGGIILEPFYDIHGERHQVYWSTK